MPTIHEPAFGALLRQSRTERGLSQLALSLSSGLSQRHISFLESGRSAPTRQSIDRLGSALGLTLRQTNTLLTAAGFAHAYRESTLSSEELRPYNESLEFLLRQHEPNPAYVIDRFWNLQMENQASVRFRQVLTGAPEPISRVGLNVMRAVLDPAGLRQCLRNGDTVACVLLARLRAEAALAPTDPAFAAYVQEMTSLADLADESPPSTNEVFDLATLPLEFRHGEQTLTFFTMIATLGTPLDVTLQELRLETLFPADELTRKFLNNQRSEIPI